ncbi:hypothetical protein KAI30_03220 [Candidatus Bathyarchaeota archaeon]|nr:hypothetical protein [Candidatus Bathyarchaeota archaeon]
MLLVTVAAVILFVLAVDNAYEFASVYKARAQKDKADMVKPHSRIVETGELFGFILAGILLYLSALDIIAVIVLIVVGLYHLGGALSTKQNLLEFSQEKLRRFLTVIMIVCFAEVAVAGSIVVWMASNGWIDL